MHQGLLELRNKVCLAFLLMNALFVTIVYVLTEVNASTQQTLSIKLPCTVSGGRPGRGYIEPISFAFTAIFGIMLLLQFICMLMHRMSTFIHIAASLNFDLKKKLSKGFNSDEKTPRIIGVQEGLEIVKELQTEKDDDNISIASQETAYSEDSYTRSGNKTREMWKKYTRRLRAKTSTQPQELRWKFANNLEKFSKVLDEGDNASTRGIQEERNANIHDETIEKVQKAFRNRFNTKTLHVVRTLAENSNKTQEIKRRATALKQRNRIKSHWTEATGKVLLQKEAENGVRNGRTSRVGFALVAKAAVAQEKRKHLDEPDENLFQDRDEEGERAGRTSRVGFALVAKAAHAQEKRKHLDEPDKNLFQDRDEKGERAGASSAQTQNLELVKENDEENLSENDSKKEEYEMESSPPEHQESGQENNVESINL
jgi:chitin synthase